MTPLSYSVLLLKPGAMFVFQFFIPKVKVKVIYTTYSLPKKINVCRKTILSLTFAETNNKNSLLKISS